MHVSRSLRRAPSFTILAVSILALGIGTSTAVFEAFRSVALVELPVSEPERIVTLSVHDNTGAGVALTPDEIDALNGVTPALQAVAGALSGTGTMPVTEDDRPLVLNFAFVTSGFSRRPRDEHARGLCAGAPRDPCRSAGCAGRRVTEASTKY